MKFDSKEIKNSELSRRIVDVVKGYIDEILDEFDNRFVIEVVDVRVSIKDDRVFVLYNDYSEEEERLHRILSEAMSIKVQLSEELSKDDPDNIKIVVLENKLSKLVDEFNKLKPVLKLDYELYDVI